MNLDSVAIIIINYNGLEDTKECITSLLDLNYENKKIYVLDNNSPDGSGELLSQYVKSIRSKQIQFIQSNKNLGFTGGNNFVIELAMQEGYEYIWLVNNDTILDEFSLNTLIEAMASDNRLGMASSRIYYYNTDKWWFIGGKITRFGHIFQIKDTTDVEGNGGLFYQTDYITGCSFLVRTQVIKEIGRLSEDYFMYFEDTEWCIRAKKSGWKIGCVPKSLMWHKVSASTQSREKDSSPLKQYFQIRNHFYIINSLYKGHKKVIPYLLRMYWIFRRFLSITLIYRNNMGQKYRSLFKAVIHAGLNKKGNNF